VFDAAHIATWPKGSDSFVEAFAKGLAVIVALGDGAEGLSISDVAARTGLGRAGSRRLLLTLVQLEMASQKGTLFFLTPRVLRLGFAYLSSLTIREIAQPLIEGLAKQVGEPVAVSVFDGGEIVYVARATSARVLSRNLLVGSRLPAYCTSMGRVLLANKNEAELDVYFKETELVRLTQHTICDPDRLRRELRTVREQGWAVVFQELEIGVCGLAAPIRDGTGAVVGAINLSANLSRHTEKSYVETCLPPLLKTAASASTLLPRSLEFA
jgi:IclR family pca regulon transcriptional regulator